MNTLNRNSTSFPIKVQELLNNLQKANFNEPDKHFIKNHQLLIKRYYTHVRTGARGLLLFHSLGSGKTIASISIAEAVCELEDKNVIVLLTKSLENNFKNDYRKYKRIVDKNLTDQEIEMQLKSRYSFISMNASNMATQFYRLGEEELRKETGARKKDEFETMQTLDDKILLVDEYHNLGRSIINGGQNARKLYELIMYSKNLRLIFLSATPIASDPFELVPCFNMLAGTINAPILPDTWEEFNNYFVDREKGVMKNKGKFQNRIMGLLSHIDVKYNTKTFNEDYPLQLPIEIVKVPLSPYQYTYYTMARKAEKLEAGDTGKGAVAPMSKPKMGSSSTYRVKSRQYSNFVYPMGKNENNINDLTKNEIEVGSSKMVKLVELMKSNFKKGKRLSLIYSQFVTNTLNVLKKYLDYCDFKEYSDNKRTAEYTYAMISGDIDIDERSRLQKIFNSNDNVKGGVIDVFIISSTGIEGLSLFGIRNVYILEPYWHYGRLEQIMGRALRFKSHIRLPQEERNFQTYLFLSTSNEPTESTTDVELYEKAIQRQILINQFLDALKEVAIDCSTIKDKPYNCRVCAPTDVPLFITNINRDMKVDDPCSSLKTKELKADIISVDIWDGNGKDKQSKMKDFAYLKDDSSIMGYKILQKKGEAYITLEEYSDLYKKVHAKILELTNNKK